MRGDARTGHDLASGLYQQWRDRHGPDDAETLAAGHTLPMPCGQWAAPATRASWAKPYWLGTVGCWARTTPAPCSATGLAIDLRALGEHQAARELDEDTLARNRRVLGEDHPSTLTTATNLAVDLRALSDHQTARELDEDTLARKRRVLGEDHPAP